MAHYENTRAKRERQVYRSDKRECVIEKERERERYSVERGRRKNARRNLRHICTKNVLENVRNMTTLLCRY